MSTLPQTGRSKGVTESVTASTEPSAPAGIGTGMLDTTLAALPQALAEPPPEPPEFDAWLRRHLEGLHAGVLTEPVPERFLRILKGQAD